MRGLQSGAHAEPDAQHSSGVVRAGHGVSERPSNASFGLSAVRKITSQVLENSAITQTHLEIARSARFFSGLLGDRCKGEVGQDSSALVLNTGRPEIDGLSGLDRLGRAINGPQLLHNETLMN